MTDTDYTEAVARGMALLEETEPGCLDGIDLSTLDISSADQCVVAQALGDGDYATGIERMGLSDNTALCASYGFCLYGPEITALMDQHDYAAVMARYAPLTEAWLKALSARLSADQPTG